MSDTRAYCVALRETQQALSKAHDPQLNVQNPFLNGKYGDKLVLVFDDASICETIGLGSLGKSPLMLVRKPLLAPNSLHLTCCTSPKTAVRVGDSTWSRPLWDMKQRSFVIVTAAQAHEIIARLATAEREWLEANDRGETLPRWSKLQHSAASCAACFGVDTESQPQSPQPPPRQPQHLQQQPPRPTVSLASLLATYIPAPAAPAASAAPAVPASAPAPAPTQAETKGVAEEVSQLSLSFPCGQSSPPAPPAAARLLPRPRSPAVLQVLPQAAAAVGDGKEAKEAKAESQHLRDPLDQFFDVEMKFAQGSGTPDEQALAAPIAPVRVPAPVFIPGTPEDDAGDDGPSSSPRPHQSSRGTKRTRDETKDAAASVGAGAGAGARAEIEGETKRKRARTEAATSSAPPAQECQVVVSFVPRSVTHCFACMATADKVRRDRPRTGSITRQFARFAIRPALTFFDHCSDAPKCIETANDHLRWFCLQQMRYPLGAGHPLFEFNGAMTVLIPREHHNPEMLRSGFWRDESILAFMPGGWRLDVEPCVFVTDGGVACVMVHLPGSPESESNRPVALVDLVRWNKKRFLAQAQHALDRYAAKNKRVAAQLTAAERLAALTAYYALREPMPTILAECSDARAAAMPFQDALARFVNAIAKLV